MVSDLNAHESVNRRSKRLDEKYMFTVLNNMLKALEAFDGNYHKKLNYEKLVEYLKLSDQDANNALTLIFKFQKVFKTTFKHHQIQRKIVNGAIYLIADKDNTCPLIPKQIHMTHSSAQLLSDVTYTFKHVNRGKGFNLKFTNTELLKNIKTLKATYPYLFMENGNNLTYPSEMGLLLGETILSYSKTHKKLTDIELNNSLITFEEDVRT